MVNLIDSDAECRFPPCHTKAFLLGGTDRLSGGDGAREMIKLKVAVCAYMREQIAARGHDRQCVACFESTLLSLSLNSKRPKVNGEYGIAISFSTTTYGSAQIDLGLHSLIGQTSHSCTSFLSVAVLTVRQ